MARDTQEVDARAHIPRAKIQFAFRFRSIQVYRYSFVTLLLELLSANHTEASSHNNAAFCHVMFSVYARAFSARELIYLNLRRNLPVSIFAIHFLSNERKTVRNYSTSYQVQITCARILPNASIIGLRAPLTARFEQILIRFNNKF